MCVLLKPKTIYSISNASCALTSKSNYLEALSTYITSNNLASTSAQSRTTTDSSANKTNECQGSSKVNLNSNKKNDPKQCIVLGPTLYNSDSNATCSTSSNKSKHFPKSPFYMDSEFDNEI